MFDTEIGGLTTPIAIILVYVPLIYPWPFPIAIEINNYNNNQAKPSREKNVVNRKKKPRRQ